MAITWADVTAIAPELSSVAIGSQTAILADVVLQISVTRWGSQARADMGSKYLAAHLGTLVGAGGSGRSGPVISESVDGVNRSYAAGFTQPDSYDATSYGREFKRLMRSLVIPRLGILS